MQKTNEKKKRVMGKQTRSEKICNVANLSKKKKGNSRKWKMESITITNRQLRR